LDRILPNLKLVSLALLLPVLACASGREEEYQIIKRHVDEWVAWNRELYDGGYNEGRAVWALATAERSDVATVREDIYQFTESIEKRIHELRTKELPPINDLHECRNLFIQYLEFEAHNKREVGNQAVDIAIDPSLSLDEKGRQIKELYASGKTKEDQWVQRLNDQIAEVNTRYGHVNRN
jgi:hypothetical protein